MQMPYTTVDFNAGHLKLGLQLINLQHEVFQETPGERQDSVSAQKGHIWFLAQWCSLLERVRNAGTDLDVDVCLDHLKLERLRVVCWSGPQAEWPESLSMRVYVNASPSEEEALAFGYATMMLVRSLTSYRDRQARCLLQAD